MAHQQLNLGFVETCLTKSIADARRLEVAVAKSGSIVHVGYIHLHNLAFRKEREIVPSLGPIRYQVFEGLSTGPFRNNLSSPWGWLPHPLSMAP